MLQTLYLGAIAPDASAAGAANPCGRPEGVLALRIQKQIADEQLAAAQAYRDAAFNRGLWGPWPGW